MVTNQNRLSPYLGFLLYFQRSQSYRPFVITHRISKCLKHIRDHRYVLLWSM